MVSSERHPADPQELSPKVGKTDQIGGWEWEISSQTMIWTDELYRLHGIDPTTIPFGSKTHIDRSLDCYDPVDRQVVVCAFQRCCETGEPFDLQVPFTPFIGNRIWIRSIGCAVRIAGVITKIIGNVIDITHQRLNDETLQRNEESFHLLAQYAPVPIVFHDKNGRIEFLNTRFTETFGYSTCELPDIVTWWNRACPDEAYRQEARSAWKRAIDQAILNKSDIKQTEFQIMCKDGKTRTTEIFGSRIGDKFLVLLNDVSERKHAAEASRAEENCIRSLLRLSQKKTTSLKELLDLALDESLALTSSTAGYILLYDEDTHQFTVHAWSKEVMKECGISSPPSSFQLEHTGLWGEAVRQRRTILINDFQAPNPMKRGYPAGHTHITRFLTVPIFSEGRIVAVTAVANKPSEYTDLEVNQLTLMTDSIWKMVEQKRSENALQKSLEEQTALLKEVHHRVKNNLQIVSSLLNLQAAKLKNPELRHILSDTQNRVRSMALLHETLYRSGNLSQISLSAYFESLCAHLFRAIGPDSPRIRLERQVENMTLPLDQAVPCGLIINELVSNALKHAFPDGRSGAILVESRFVEPGEIALTVSDDGIGLPVDIHPEKTATLGLQLVTMLSEQLQGSLEVFREAGTRFRLTFPLMEK